MKRIISLCLLLGIMLSLVQPALAVSVSETNSFENENTLLEEIKDGHLFLSKNEDKIVVILTNDEDHFISASIIYENKPDLAYEWKITDYPMTTFLPNELSFWEGVVEYVESRMEEALCHESVIEVTDGPVARSNTINTLNNKLQEIHGDSYSDTKIRTDIRDGQSFYGYESLSFTVVPSKTVSWSAVYSIGLILASYFGIVPKDKAIEALLGVLGLALGLIEASTEIPPGKVNTYDCKAVYTRYVKMYGSDRVWTQVSKAFYYTGAEDASVRVNKEARLLDADDVEPVYYGQTGNTEDYFNYEYMNHAYQIWRGRY